MSAEFLLEIGTEELPSSFVRHALAAMHSSAVELIGQARLGTDALEVHPMGTPRRLALRIRALADVLTTLLPQLCQQIGRASCRERV